MAELLFGLLEEAIRLTFMVVQMVQKSSYFTGPKGSIHYLQQPAARPILSCSCPVHRLAIDFLKIHFNDISHLLLGLTGDLSPSNSH